LKQKKLSLQISSKYEDFRQYLLTR